MCYIVSVRNVVATRKCFHKCLSFCLQWGGVWYTPRADTPPPRRTPPPPRPASRRLLQRTVRILLECILVLDLR